MAQRSVTGSETGNEKAKSSRRRGPGRPKAGSEDKSARILKEALTLFSRDGYAGVSLEDIARASDLSKAGLLHHYPSKDALFAAVLRERDRRTGDTLELSKRLIADPWEIFELWLKVLEENYQNRAGTALYVAMTVAVTNVDHPAHDWFTHHLNFAVRGFYDSFEYGKKIGTVAPDAPSQELARILAALSDGLQIQYLAHATDVEAGEGHAGNEVINTNIVEETRVIIQLIEDRWRVYASDSEGSAP